MYLFINNEAFHEHFTSPGWNGITDIDTLLMVENSMRGMTCHVFNKISTWKNYDKNKESSCLKYLDVINF